MPARVGILRMSMDGGGVWVVGLRGVVKVTDFPSLYRGDEMETPVEARPAD